MVYMNQLGYQPNATKHAVLEVSKDTEFIITNDEKMVVYRGVAICQPEDQLSGIKGAIADFSGLKVSGKYYLSYMNDEQIMISSSFFSIQEDVYHNLNNDLIRMLYFQRCGCELTKEFAGPFAHEACHTQKASLYEDPAVQLDVSGGWHDAGDYGRYITPAAIAVSHMLWAYERMPKKFDRSLHIPESKNQLPDLLNEAAYELRWMLKMQREDGGVYHKVTTHHHAPFIMPEKDVEELIILPVSSMATAMFAASMAQASHIFSAFDPDFSKRMLEASLRSYEWLMENEDFLPFKNPSDCRTGEYYHRGDGEKRLWASVELLRALHASGASSPSKTQNGTYLSDIMAHCRETILLAMADDNINKTSFGWGETGGLAMLGIVYNGNDIFSTEHYLQAGSILTQEASKQLALTQNLFEVPMAANHFFWGSNMTMMCRGMLFVFAYDLTQNPAYQKAAQTTLDYLLGKNILDFSYVSGYGHNCLKDPHNRPTSADGITEMIPGFVAGGPNNGYLDPFAKELFGDGPYAPMASYRDDARCYSLNEIAIYWNTPAIFVSAYFS